MFTGVVTDKVHESQLSLRYTLRVGIEHKGDVPDTAEVVTYGVATVCGLTYLQIGGEYRLFTSARGDGLRTSTCDGTRSASGGPPAAESTTTAIASSAVAAPPCDLAAA